jgi:hypothetical protein
LSPFSQICHVKITLITRSPALLLLCQPPQQLPAPSFLSHDNFSSARGLTDLPYVNSALPSLSHDNLSSARGSTDLPYVNSAPPLYHTTISALPEAQRICQQAIALARAFTIRQQRAYNASALFSPPSADPCESLRICEKCSITFSSGQALFKHLPDCQPFKCTKCDFTFPSNTTLHKHVRGCRRPKKTDDMDKSVEKQEDEERLSEEVTHKKN